MSEIHCLHCGALFQANPGLSVCPHCGANPRDLLSVIRTNVSRYFWQVFALVVPALPFLFSGRNRDAVGVVAAVFAVGITWMFMTSASQRRSRPITALEIQSRRKLEEAAPLPPPRPPETPKEWKPLVSLLRPRDVYIPFWKAVKIWGEGAFLVVALGFASSSMYAHPLEPRLWAFSRLDYVTAVGFVVALPFWLRNRFREISSRSLLRDGEVTIGVIADWISRGEGKTAVYQFWTRTGERFQHERAVVSDEKTYSEVGYVPVFYSPEDPTKSVALCCTAFRVRVPSEEPAVRLQKLGMQP